MLPFVRRSKIKNLRILADQARDRKEWESAAQLYKQVLNNSPKLPSIWVQYGHTLKEQGLLKEAELAYRHALDLDEKNADTYLQLGHVLKIQGFTEKALESYLKGFDIDGSNQNLQSEIKSLRSPYDVQSAIGTSEISEIEYKNLVNDINSIYRETKKGKLTKFNNIDDFLFRYGITLRTIELFDYQYYFYANKKVSNTLKHASFAGCLVHFVEHGITQLNTIRADYEFDPKFYLTTYSLGENISNTGLYRHWLREGINRQFWPNRNLFARSVLGYAATAVDALDLSAYAIARGHTIEEWGWSNTLLDFISHGAADTRPGNCVTEENIFVYLEIGDKFAREGKDESALVVYERILNKFPNHYQTLRNYGDVMIRKGCIFSAIQAFKKVISTPYANPWSFLNLASCQEKLGDFEAAADVLYRATKIFPGDMYLKDQLWSKAGNLSNHTWQAATILATTGQLAKAQSHIARIHRHIADFTSVTDSVAPAPVSSIALFANQHLPQCTFYRVEQKVEQLEQAGLEVEVFDQDTGLDDFLSSAHRFQAVIFYRVPALPNILQAIGVAKALGISTFYEIDDLIFNEELYPPKFENYAGMITKAEYVSLALGVPLFRIAMELCDYSIASTPALVEQVKKIVPEKRVFLHRNGLDSRHLTAAKSVKPTSNDDKITIFYGSGTRAHKEDFHDLVEPALMEMVRRYGKRIRIMIVGHPPAVDPLLEMGADVVTLDTMLKPDQYWAMLRCADINLAMLHSTELTDTKSEIKWLEAAMMGIPSVVSATQTYREVIEDGVDGFLCSTPEQWSQALDTLISSSTRRQAIGNAAREKVFKYYLPEKLGKDLRNIIDSVTAEPHSKKKTRVLIVNVFYPPQAIGGATRVVHDNVRDIVAQYGEDFHIEVVSTIEGGAVPYQVRSHAEDGIRVHGITTPDRPDIDHITHDPQMGNIFGKLLTELKPDLVHFHCIQRLTLSVIDACQNQSVPYLVTAHDGWWISRSQFLVNEHTNKLDIFRFDKALQSVSEIGDEDTVADIANFSAKHGALKQAKHVLAVSKSFAEIYQQCGIDNVLSVPNGLSAFSKTKRTSDPDGYVRLGFIGGLAKHKGFHLVNYALTGNHFKNLRLIAIDHGAPAGTLRHETWGNTPVEFRPKVKQSQVTSLYADIDVLLAPSIWPESFGLVTREASWCGCWIVASDRGAIGEDVIENYNGFKIDVSDPTDLARVLSEIDKNPQRYRSPAPVPENIRPASEQAKDLANIYKNIANMSDKESSIRGK